MRSLALLPLLGLFAACGGSPNPPPLSPKVAEHALLPPGTVRYIVGGDSRNDLSRVLPWSFHEAKARKASAFLFLGDMEITPDQDAQFAEELALLDPIPFYPALGNHEVNLFGVIPVSHAKAERRFRDMFLGKPRTPVESSLPGKVVYSVTLTGGLHFVALDNVSQNGFGRDQLDWLGKDLEAARANPAVKYTLVGMHKPLARNGVTPHSMDADGAQAIADSDEALALCVKHKVSLLIASHMHEFDSFKQAGIPAYITGGLGAPLTRTGGDHAFHHFLQVDLSDAGIKVDVVRFDGKPTIEETPEVE